MRTLIDIIFDHITYRKQIVKLAKSNLVKTYRGTALGWAWALVKPVVMIFVFWFAFTYGLRSGSPVNGYSFFLWLISGFIPWFYMSEMISGGAGCIRANRHMVTKMKFPVAVIPTFVSLSKIVVHFVLMLVVVILFMLFGHAPDIYLLQLPLYMLMMFVFFTAWALFAGMLSAISKDFLNLVKSLTQAIFWMSGIIYNVDSISIPWIRTVLSYNPVTIVATGYRNALINKVWFFEDVQMLGNYFIVLIVMVILAIWAYKKLYKDIADVM